NTWEPLENDPRAISTTRRPVTSKTLTVPSPGQSTLHSNATSPEEGFGATAIASRTPSSGPPTLVVGATLTFDVYMRPPSTRTSSCAVVPLVPLAASTT